MKNRIISVFCIIISIVIISFLFIGVKDYRNDMQDKKNHYASFEQKLNEYNSVIRKADREISHLNEVLDNVEKKATLSILLCEMREEIYTEVFPLFREKGLVGTIVISGDSLPGGAGRLNDNQIHELYNAGWKIIPGYSEGDGDNGITSSAKWISDYGYSFEGAVFIQKDALTEELKESYAAAGYTTVITDVDIGSFESITTEKAGDLWSVNSIGYRSDAKNTLKEAIRIYGSIIFTVGFEYDTELFDGSVLSSMLLFLKNSVSNGELVMGPISEIRQYRIDMDNRVEEAKKIIAADLEANQKIKDDAEAAIKELPE